MITNLLHSEKNLSFDVLGIIFSYFAKEETIRHPLETLLLVCRSWNEAAAGHPTLWNHLKIYLGHNPTSRKWSARLPLRLKRCGDIAPLYIDLRNYLDMPVSDRAHDDVYRDPLYLPIPCAPPERVIPDPLSQPYEEDVCSCVQTAKDFAVDALEILAGHNGVLCERWNHFELDLGYYPWVRVGNPRVAKALAFPTPNLQNLVIRNLHLDEDCEEIHLFPNTSSTTSIALFDCDIPSLPKFDNVLQAIISWDQVGDVFNHFGALRQAAQLQSLHLRLPDDFHLPFPSQLQNLISLQVDGNNFPNGLHTCEIPNLSKLVLRLEDENLLAGMLQCRNLKIEKLRTLVVVWSPMRRALLQLQEGILQSLHELLSLCSNLERIEMEGRVVSIFFKLIWQLSSDVRKQLIQGRTVVSLARVRTFKFTGDETVSSIECLAKEWGLVPPSLPNSRFFDGLSSR